MVLKWGNTMAIDFRYVILDKKTKKTKKTTKRIDVRIRDAEKISGKQYMTIDNLLELSWYTAKATVTNVSAYSIKVRLLALSFFHLAPIVFSSTPGNLQIHDDFKDVFRDFSRTTRIGEFAQGINYLFARKVLRAQAVYDFEDFYNSYSGGKKIKRESQPDYVLRNYDGTFSLFESKGSFDKTDQTVINDGLKQCKQGRKTLRSISSLKKKIKNMYCSLVVFKPEGSTGDSFMCIDDPSEEAEAEDIDRKASMVYELSKAVCLAGKIDLANEMKTDKVISSYMKQELFSEEDPLIIGELKDEEGHVDYGIKVGIQEEMKKYILEKESSGKPDIRSGYVENENRLYLDDGTFLQLK